jgi:hypothetical protein
MTAPPIKLPLLNCRKKRRFSDEFAARAAAQERLQQLGQKDGLSVYRCVHCRGWHLTSKRGAPRYLRVTDTDVYPLLTERKAA